jgi:hypothetical protein
MNSYFLVMRVIQFDCTCHRIYETMPQCHKTFEYSQEISESENVGAENFRSMYILKSENIINAEDILNSTIL